MKTSHPVLNGNPSYPPLPLDRSGLHIRLLTLRPGRLEDPLQGTLRIVDLGRVHHGYEALSYTWGERVLQPPPVIVLNGRYRLAITDNLFAALRRLRHRLQTRSLWVDALCINQSDLEERSHQVSMMGIIYSLARRVCVWLGEAPDVSSLHWMAVQMLPSYILRQVSKRRVAGRAQGPCPPYAVAREKLLAPYLLILGETVASALANSQPMWHTRAWVYPELNNAKRLLWCFGPFQKEDGPEALARFLRTTLFTGFSSPRIKAKGAAIRDLAALLARSSLHSRRDREAGFMHTTLLQNAATTGVMQATDPRDRVFSLRGVTCAEEREYLIADYEKSVAQVFAQATFASIVGSQSYDAFFYASGVAGVTDSEHKTPGLSGLPTWAIDFGQSRLPDPTSIFGRISAGRSVHAGIALDSSQPRRSPCLAQLHLQVRVFEEVHRFYGVNVNTRPSEDAAIVARLHRDPELGRISTEHLVIEPIKMDYLQNLKGQVGAINALSTSGQGQFGLRIDGQSSSMSQHSCTHESFAEVRDWFEQTDAFIGSYKPMRSDSSKGDSSNHALRILAAYIDKCCNWNVCYFVTVSGFLGAGRQVISAGDVIAFLDNSPLPIVLRPFGDVYQFVGMAYVGSPKVGALEAFWRHSNVPLREVTIV